MTMRRSRRCLRVLLAVLLCLACIPAQALVSAGTAHADGTELYAVVYKETGQKNYTLVFQNTPDAQEGYGTKKAHYTPQRTSWWIGGSQLACYGEGVEVSEIDKDYPISRAVALPGTTAPGIVAILFQDCASLTTVDLHDIETPDLKTATWMFRGCENLRTANLQGFNMGSAEAAIGLFDECYRLESVNMTHLKNFSITNMSRAFRSAGYRSKNLTINMEGTNTTKVQDMSYMFDAYGIAQDTVVEPSTLQKLSIKGLDTSNATDMSRMFSYMNLRIIDLSFLNTSSARNLDSMFMQTKNLSDADLMRLDTSNATNMADLFWMADLSNVTSLSFDTSSVRDMSGMFAWATIASLDLTKLDTSSCQNMSEMFNSANVKNCKFGSLDASSATDMSYMFAFDDLRNLNLKFLKNTGGVENMQGMFHATRLDGCDLSSLDTSGATNMAGMLQSSEFSKLDLTTFDVTNVTNMDSMFALTGAASFGPGNAVDTRGWNAASLLNTHYMFAGSGYSTIVLPAMTLLPGADVSEMFDGCETRIIDLSRVNTREVDNAYNVFAFAHDYDTDPNAQLPSIGSLRQITLGVNTQLGKYLPTDALWRNSKGKVLKASQIPSYKADTYTAITATKMSQASVSVPSKTYTGKTLKPSSAAVKLGGITLKQGTDFTVSCAGGKKVGSYKVTIKGKSPFSGTKTTTFKILPKDTSVAKLAKASKGFTVTWKKPSAAARSQIDGYQVRYATASSMKGAKTVTVKGAAKTSAKVAKLKDNKTYYVQVRSYKKVSGKTYYSAWSATKSVKTKK